MSYQSPYFNGKVFMNPVPTEVNPKGAMWQIIRESMKKHPESVPSMPPGPFTLDPGTYRQPPSTGLRVTWLGHSTVLLEMDGKIILTDPVWYQRVSPFINVGPKRFFEVPIALEDLPAIDLILLSHDHYDHLDKQAMLFLSRRNIPIVTMLGVGRRLARWGISEKLITEMDWWQETEQCGIRITACPARHFSGRWINDRYTTLWGAFSIHGPRHSVFYGADSGYFEGFKEIGDRCGPFDLTFLEVGAYCHLWPDIHMGPENAAKAHRDLKGNWMMPIHWGTFNLAFHSWTEPIEKLVEIAGKEGIKLLYPAPGQVCEPGLQEIRNEWWKEVNSEW